MQLQTPDDFTAKTRRRKLVDDNLTRLGNKSSRSLPGSKSLIAEADRLEAGGFNLVMDIKEAMVAGVIRLQDPNAPPKTRRYLPHWA